MIRPCSVGDLSRICEIINDAAIAYKSAIPADCWREPYMPLDELQREAAAMTFHAIEEDGRIGGVVGHQPVPRPAGRDVTLVRHLYVETARQRRGLGSALLRHVIALTETPRLLVGMWADAPWAIAFYRKHGFSLQPDGGRLLRAYWTIPARQREASVVMGRDTLDP